MRATVLLLLALGCTPSGDAPDVDFDPADPTTDPSDPADPTDPVVEPPTAQIRPSSATMLPSADGERLYVADLDRGEVTVVDRGTRGRDARFVGAEPTRLTGHDDTVWVTLRADGEVVRLRDEDGTLVEEARAWVGAEPFDVVHNPWDGLLYVTLSQEDAVVQLDPTTLVETDRWPAAGEPRWIAVPPLEGGGGNALHVASAMQPVLTSIDPVADVVVSREVPTLPRFSNADCDDRDLERRVTGEIATSWDGQTLYVPTLFADTRLPAPPAGLDTGDVSFQLPDEGCADLPDVVAGWQVMYYGGLVPFTMPASIGRFEPALVEVPLGGEDDPRFVHLGTRGTTALGAAAARRGYPKSLTLHYREGETVSALVTMEATNDLLFVNLKQPSREGIAPGFVTRTRATQRVAEGPSAAALINADNEVWTYSWIDRSLQSWSLVELADVGGLGGRALSLAPEHTVRLDDSPLSDDILAGRALFHSAENPRIVDPSFGTSCANCHVEGRTDGITWQFLDMPRQTPSLAGRVSDTVPLTWQEGVSSVAEEATITSIQRMAGTGPTTLEAQQIQAYVDHTRRPVPPPLDAALVDQGRALFERADVGCVACHAGDAGTNGQMYTIVDGAHVDTPALRGIAATAPYFHDGSARTLRDVLEFSRDGSMGNTGSLSDAEMDALEAYLKSR
jgi:mono/diheme cytochrome c family protein